jgi:hypothetical protein
MKKGIEKLELNRDIKILLLQALKQNQITVVQANLFVDFLSDNELIDRICIQFVDFSQKKVE